MKLSFWGDKPQDSGVKSPDENDVLRGKYDYEDLIWRKRQHLANPLEGKPDTEEELDTQTRQLSVVTNGSGALGKDWPIGPIDEIKFEKLRSMVRWANATLAPNNQLRQFLNFHFKDRFHTNFNRGVERDTPEYVMSYKPMFYPGNPNPQAPDDGRKEQSKKP